MKYDVDQGQDERYGTMKLQDKDIEPFVVDGIYWSEAVERCIPKGISEEEADQWLSSVHSLSVRSVRAASWNRCGGHPNAFVTLRNGTSLCARYRPSNVSLVLGEVLSYWLSRLLGLDCVPPVALTSSESLLRQKPRDFHSQRLDWRTGETVALIRWVDRMDSSPNTKVLMPHRILKAYRSGQPITVRNLEQGAASHSNSQNRRHFSWKRETDESRPGAASNAHVDREMGEPQMEDLVLLAQWGTMVIFDYLTGNYDRVASMQDGAEQENDTRILEESIRNLRPSDRGVKLWLIDNECGLLDAYTVLYLKSAKSSKFIGYHESMLRTMCIFQRDVVHALQDLHKEREPHQLLMRYATKRDNLIKRIERDESFQLFQENFKNRLNNVVKWIHFCLKKTNSHKP